MSLSSHVLPDLLHALGDTNIIQVEVDQPRDLGLSHAELKQSNSNHK